ncbi:MAG: TaqI-like C-terminal specificity domain-containing protein [Saprospiraceae bacterium]
MYYDEEGYFAEATTFLMTAKKLKYLLAILNSKVSEWYLIKFLPLQAGTNRWKKYKIELLPIKIPTLEQEESYSPRHPNPHRQAGRRHGGHERLWEAGDRPTGVPAVWTDGGGSADRGGCLNRDWAD